MKPTLRFKYMFVVLQSRDITFWNFYLYKDSGFLKIFYVMIFSFCTYLICVLLNLLQESIGRPTISIYNT
jgi:hypothetical protein